MHRWDVYRGARSGGGRRLPNILLFVAVLLLLGFVALFFTLPGYLVYTRESVKLELPGQQTAAPAAGEATPEGEAVSAQATPAPDYSELTAELVVREPDYASLALADGAGLDIVQSVFVPYEKMNSDGLTAAIAKARTLDVKALTLELRDESGILLWVSDAPTASNYALNGTQDLSATVEDLKKQGYRLAAMISCCVDNTQASRNAPATLKNAAGFPYSDSYGSWMDPWDSGTREFAIDMAAELMRMGFDEVILNHVAHPTNDVQYSRNMSGTLTRVACVTNFAIVVREGLQDVMDETGATLAAVMDTEPMNDAKLDNGQNLSYFLKIFDRVYEYTETYSEASQVVALGIDSTERFVPIISWVFPGASWAQNHFFEE